MNKNEVPAYFDDAEIADIEDVAMLENLTPQQVVEIATKEYLLSRKTGSNASVATCPVLENNKWLFGYRKVTSNKKPR